MTSRKPTRGGGWNFRAIVCVAALALSVPAGGKLFGSTPGYVQADSSAFATSLLDLNRGDWSREGRANFVAHAAPQQLADPMSLQVPVEATTGGATFCPKVYTTCPQSPTTCELTKCPPATTVCPIANTSCPKVPTMCPIVATECELTICPPRPTLCPVVPTTCESTKCPTKATICPVVPTTCQLTVCPKTTVCGSEKTICYGGATPSICEEQPLNPAQGPPASGQRALLARGEPQRALRPLAVTFMPQTN